MAEKSFSQMLRNKNVFWPLFVFQFSPPSCQETLASTTWMAENYRGSFPYLFHLALCHPASLLNFSQANPFNQLAVTRSHHDFSKLLLSMFLTDINMEPSFCMVLSVRLIIRGCLCGGCWASGEPARQFRNSCRSWVLRHDGNQTLEDGWAKLNSIFVVGSV